MERRSITIREVAADAGVGTATVSRVLNEPWRVSPATIERVKASIEKLGYKPNFRARLLARGNSGTICFLLANRPFISSIHAEILQGAAQQADIMGVQVVYTSSRYSPNAAPGEIQMPQILAARGLIDGVVLAGTNYPNIIKAIEELELPYVVFGTNYVNTDGNRLRNAVYVDEETGAYQATKHLISLGHKKIIYIGDVSFPWHKHRYEGYAKAMGEAGIKAEPPVGSMQSGSLQMGSDAVEELCEAGKQFTALFAGGDIVAYGAIRALRNRGFVVPEDVSVVGFNDDEMASISEPPLTTVRVPTEEIGARCVLMLDEIIRNGEHPAEPITLPVDLVVRESTAPPKRS